MESSSEGGGDLKRAYAKLHIKVELLMALGKAWGSASPLAKCYWIVKKSKKSIEFYEILMIPIELQGHPCHRKWAPDGTMGLMGPVGPSAHMG